MTRTLTGPQSQLLRVCCEAIVPRALQRRQWVGHGVLWGWQRPKLWFSEPQCLSSEFLLFYSKLGLLLAPIPMPPAQGRGGQLTKGDSGERPSGNLLQLRQDVRVGGGSREVLPCGTDLFSSEECFVFPSCFIRTRPKYNWCWHGLGHPEPKYLHSRRLSPARRSARPVPCQHVCRRGGRPCPGPSG